MRVLNLWTASLPVLFILGCSVGKDSTQELNRARDVQKAVDSNTADTRKAVDAQERGDAPERDDNHP